jgi:hypothetical protein
MITVLQELDIKSRAVVSIVDDWQGPVASGTASDLFAAKEGSRPVRSVWKLDDIVDLIIQTVEAAGRVPGLCDAIDKDKAIADREVENIISTLDGVAKSLELLARAIATAVSIVEMFESQGIRVARANDLRECSFKFNGLVNHLHQFSEALGWDDLNRRALSSEEFKQLTQYLIETGKASA